MSTVPAKLVIIGDFNLHVDKASDSYAQRFLDIVDSLGFRQEVNGPTHNLGHTLDLVLSRESDNSVTSIFVNNGEGISDHSVIECTLKTRPTRWPTKTISFRSLKSISMDALCADIHSLPLIQSPATSLDDRINQYNDGLRLVLDRHAPLQSKTMVLRPAAPWMTEKIRGQKAHLRWAERCWRAAKRKGNARAHHLHKVYKKTCFRYSSSLNEARIESVKEQVTECSRDRRALFRLVGDLTGATAPPTLPDRPNLQETADEFSDFFASKISAMRSSLDRAAETISSHTLRPEQSFLRHHEETELLHFRTLTVGEVTKLIESSPTKSCSLDPMPTHLLKKCLVVLSAPITDIINLSLSTGVFPSSLKHGIITPLLKKPSLDRNLLANYRPVSNLSFLSKLIERAVLMLLTEHLTKFNLLPDHQSAYRANYSTETALVSLYNDLLETADAGEASALLLLDLSAAFDTIDQQILIDRLSHYFGISDPAVCWFVSYLSDRTQSVQIGNVSSGVILLLFGVAQGSVLGGPLFIMYVAPLADATAVDGVDVRQFSDDSQAKKRFALQPDFADQRRCCTELARWAVNTNDWLTLNRVQLNIVKCILLYATTSSNADRIDPMPLQVGPALVQPTQEATNLGVVMDSHLTMAAHVRRTCRAALFHLSRINKIRRFLDFFSAKCVVNALVISRLDYCNALYLGLSDDLLKRLQRVLNAAARTIFNLRRRDPISQHLKSLGWLPISERAKFKVACLSFRCLYGTAPLYLSSLLTPHVPTRDLRSSNKNLLVTNPFRLVKYGKRAFSRSAPLLWNSLPDSVRLSPTLSSFRSRLYKDLFSKSYST